LFETGFAGFTGFFCLRQDLQDLQVFLFETGFTGFTGFTAQGFFRDSFLKP